MDDSNYSIAMDNSEAIIHIVDDDEAVRDSLGMLCAAANLRAQVYSSAATFLRTADFSLGGCIVLDIRMPGTSGLELQEELHKRRIGLPIIFLTGHADVSMAVRAMKRGAFDFLEKPPEPQSLLLIILNALRLQHQQESQKSLISMPPVTPSEADRTRLVAQLSKREREVAMMVVEGIPSRIIAETLFLSVKTVEFHRARIREKLGVNSTIELLRMLS